MRLSLCIGICILLVAPAAVAQEAFPEFMGPVGFALQNGDVNGDLERDVSDGVYTLSNLFLGGPPAVPLAYCGGEPSALQNGDMNDDGAIDISDPVRLFAWLFIGASEPAPACGEGQGGAANTNPRVIPPNANAFGKSYGEWGAAWQQWGFNTTTGSCPITDTTGEFALVAQSGKVYFLAGTFGENPGTPWAAPNPVHRTVTIPTGVALCLPLNNWGLIYPEDVQFTEAPPDATWEEAMPFFYKAVNGAYDNMNEANLVCEVDGVALTNLLRYRAQSAPFQVYVPANNVQNDLMDYFMYGELPPDPGTFYAEGWHTSVSDGYYVMLAPLSAGKHTIHLQSVGFCDVYYNLTVAGGAK